MNKIAQNKLSSIMAVFLSILVVLFCGTQTVYALNILDSDLNSNGIVDSAETEVVVTSNKSLPAGEYNFDNLTITNKAALTLVGDPLSPDPFKGVKINATNISVSLGSSISANGQGYSIGPGSGTGSMAASYGGAGGGNTTTSTYGSATRPIDLGSGASGTRGGGAIRIIATDTILNDGSISANGSGYRSSGGSIYITANSLKGNGAFTANGGNTSWPNSFAGGGGRIALHYGQSSFSGSAKASSGVFCFSGCNPAGDSGTVAFFDTSNNDLYTGTSWRFQKNDEPLNLNRIIVSDDSSVTMDEGVAVTASELVVSEGTSLPLSKGSLLTIHKITVDGATIVSSGEETIVADTLKLTNSAVVTVVPMQTLTLSVTNVTIDASSRISVDAKGDTAGAGFPSNISAGGSHGGVGLNNTATSTYGSAKQPTTLGSAGGASHAIGGGAIRLVVSGALVNNGTISADGNTSSSGGSIYATVANMSGSGTFHANGGALGGGGYFSGPGGGGRIAIYYQTSSFTGTTQALGGCGSYDGWSQTCAGDGTVVIERYGAVCTINCYSNIMFLPGVMGSRLYEEITQLDCSNLVPAVEPATLCNPTEKELWVSMNDAFQERLKLGTDGKSINSVYTKDDTRNNGELDETGLVDDAYGQNIYQSFINDLRTWKNDEKIIEDYAFIPYDWRLSLNDIITNGATTTSNKLSYSTSQLFSESYILKQLEQLQKSSRTGKVTIVAHSNGGLVTKALIEKLKTDGNPLYNQIDKVIFVAVPQVGTPDAVVGLLHGKQLGDTVRVMSAARSRALAQNMPTMYNLLPTTDYYTYVDDPVITFEDKPGLASWRTKYGDVIHSQWALDNFLTDKLRVSLPTDSILNEPAQINNTLLAQAEAVHLNLLDSWAPATTTKVIQVAGWGLETLSGIDYVYDGKLSPKPRKIVDGDGTVVVPSALWMATSTQNVERWWVDLKTYNDPLLGFNRKHGDILEVGSLRNFIKSEINNSSFTDPDKFVINDTSTLVSGKPRLHFTLHSPLTLGITDSSGRYTGLDPVTGEIKEEIPNTSYEQYGEVQFLSVPAGLQYTLKLKGYETGTFALDVEKQIGNTVTESATFQAIPSETSTVVTMDITSVFEVASSTLNIDQNNDGVTDVLLDANPSGVTIYDLTAPVTTITLEGTLGSNGYYTSAVAVTLTADDVAPLGEVSSGVASTKYSLDSGVTWDTYSTSTPLVIATEGTSTLQYYSVDNNENSESVKVFTLNIDTVTPTIFASDVSAEQLTLSGTNLAITATAEDNVEVNPTIISSTPLSQIFAPGTTDITLTATDIAGNISTKTITVTIFSSPTADPDGDCVVNVDDVNPFDLTVFANLVIPAEYSFWEKGKFTLPFSVAGKGVAKLSLSATYYKVSDNPIRDAQGVVVLSTNTEVDGVITITFPQNTKELTTYNLELTTKKGNTKERDSIKKKRDNETDHDSRHELEKELDFASAPISLSLQSLSCPNTTSQTATVNIYDKQQNAQVQYKYKDTGTLDFIMKSDDTIKIKKGQPLALTIKVIGVKKNVQADVTLSGNFTTLSVIQEEEHHDNDDRKQKTFTLFYPLAISTTHENITVNLTVGGIAKSAVLSVRFED